MTIFQELPRVLREKPSSQVTISSSSSSSSHNAQEPLNSNLSFASSQISQMSQSTEPENDIERLSDFTGNTLKAHISGTFQQGFIMKTADTIVKVLETLCPYNPKDLWVSVKESLTMKEWCPDREINSTIQSLITSYNEANTPIVRQQVLSIFGKGDVV